LRITQINFNGLDLISDDYFFNILGLFDIEKDITTNDMYTDGDNFGGSKIKSKKLVLNGIINAWSSTVVLALNRAIAAKGLKELRVTIPQIGVLTGNVEVASRLMGDTSVKVSMQLIMTDPYLYAETAEVITLGPVQSSGLSESFTEPIVFGPVTGGSGIIINRGIVESYPIISVIGECSAVELRNITTGENMTLNISLADGDTLVIDNNPVTRSIKVNGINRMDLKVAADDWFTCVPGDNEFTFNRSSLQSEVKHCSISLQSRWI
jgi:phage-related protein